MKKLITILLMINVCLALSAMTLPTGEDVQVSDFYENDEGKIIKVILDEDAEFHTVLYGLFVAKKGTPVEFYDSGKLKALYCMDRNLKLDKFAIYGQLFTEYSPLLMCPVTFYESGFLKSVAVKKLTTKVMPASKLVVDDYYIPTKGTYSVKNQSIIEFYDNGTAIKSLMLSSSEKLPADVYVGKRHFHASKKSDITFHENGSVESFYSRESERFDTVFGMKESKPDTQLCFYEDGTLRSFVCNEKISITAPDGKYVTDPEEPVVFHQDGSPEEMSFDLLKKEVTLGNVKFATEREMYPLTVKYHWDGDYITEVSAVNKRGHDEFIYFTYGDDPKIRKARKMTFTSEGIVFE